MNTNTDPIRPEYRPENVREEGPWYRFREQIPAILVTVILVGVTAAWIFGRSSSRTEAAIQPLREQNEALRAQADENRHQLEATTALLRNAISHKDGELFKSDEEIQKINGDRINTLADAIAQKVAPALPAKQTPEQLAQAEDDQVEKISARTADKLRPDLKALTDSQKGMNKEVVAQYNERIQTLNNKVQQTQSAAQDALRLSHQVSSMYLNTYEDQTTIDRIFSFPGHVVRDTMTGNIWSNRDEKKQRKELDQKMQQIEERLNQIQATQTSTTSAAVSANVATN